MEICDTNRFYGHGNIIKKYCNYPMDEPIPVAIQHGYNLFANLKHEHFYEPLFDYWIYTSRVRQNMMTTFNVSSDSLHILGSPFIYLVDDINYYSDSDRKKGTIVFPSHSIPDNQIVGSYDRYAEQLKLLPSEFQPITVCLHYHDIKLRHHLAFYKRGFAVVTCANSSPLQDNYLHNFIHFCKSHRYIISNNFGTASIYGMYLGLKFFIYGEEMKYNPTSEKEKNNLTDANDLEYDRLRKSFQLKNLEDINIIDTQFQFDFASAELGAKYKLSREELLEFLIELKEKRPYIEKIKPFFQQVSQSFVNSQKASPPMTPLKLKEVSQDELLSQAINYKQTLKWKISLKNVTLITASSVDINNCLLSLYLSSLKLDFEQIIFFTPEDVFSPILNLFDNLKIIKINKIKNLIDYSRFIIKELHKYIETDYCLISQNDGFVINPEKWDKDFLQYDYIGAPWPKNIPLLSNGKVTQILDMSRNRVGNGGFSLRSKKLLKLASQLDFDKLLTSSKSEDLIICHYYDDWFRENGIKFAPLEIATKFSFEQTVDEFPEITWENSFGFHGKPHLKNVFNNLFEKFAEICSKDNTNTRAISAEKFVKLTNINYLVFPNWETEEELSIELSNLLYNLANPFSNEQNQTKQIITLLINTTCINEEDASLILSGIAMNLMMEEELDIESYFNLVFIDELDAQIWTNLLSKVTAKINLANENIEVIKKLDSDEEIVTINSNGSNYVIFPDWKTPPEELSVAVSDVLTQIANNDGENTTLLVDVSNADVEEVGLFFSEIAMNLVLVEGIELDETINLSFVNFTSSQWQSIEFLVKKKIDLSCESLPELLPNYLKSKN